MTSKSNPDNDVINLPRSEYRDWTGAEEALSKLARITGAQRPDKPDAAAAPDAPVEAPDAAPTTPDAPPKPARRKRKASRVLARYLMAIGVGVVGTLAWQAHGDLAKQTAAGAVAAMWHSHGEPTRKAAKQWLADVWKARGEPARQTVAGWIPRIVWPAQHAQPANAPAAPTVDAIAPGRAAERAAASIDPQALEALAGDLTALRQSVELLAASQEQMAHDIARLQAEQIMRPKIPVAQRWRAAATRSERRRSRVTNEP